VAACAAISYCTPQLVCNIERSRRERPDRIEHNAQVIAALGPERLLVYDVAAGWEPLCAFLGMPIPTAAFPRTNLRAGFVTGLRSGIARGGRKVMPTRP